MAAGVLGSGIDPMIATRIKEYLEEALNGPEKGGIAGDLLVGQVKVEAIASRGWGVQFSRELPNGDKALEHLRGADLTIDGAGAALGKLLHAA